MKIIIYLNKNNEIKLNNTMKKLKEITNHNFKDTDLKKYIIYKMFNMFENSESLINEY